MELKAKRTEEPYEVSIKINPMPESCFDCPFYYMLNEAYEEHTWDETWICYLGGIADGSCFGIGLHRAKDCPLDKETEK